MEDILDKELKIKIGLSACLAGDSVRYNGQGAEDRFITRDLSRYFDYVKVCPEMGIGMGAPRETIRLVDDNGLRVKNHEGTNDYTDRMRDFSESKTDDLKDENLCGYIFKKGSPSCGAFRIKVYNTRGETLHNNEAGVFAKTFQNKYPWIPVEEEGRLNDAALRHNFISRVFAYRRWQIMIGDKPTAKQLVRFHQVHKYMLMSYSQDKMRELGRIVANHEKRDIAEVCHEYLIKFSELTAKPAPRKKHANVMYHIFGYFSKYLDDFDRHELVDVIEKYRTGILPLVLPVSRISHYVRKFKVEYLLGQSYLIYPEELGVLNKI